MERNRRWPDIRREVPDFFEADIHRPAVPWVIAAIREYSANRGRFASKDRTGGTVRPRRDAVAVARYRRRDPGIWGKP